VSLGIALSMMTIESDITGERREDETQSVTRRIVMEEAS